MNLFKIYWTILEGMRRRAATLVALEVIAGTLEASALVSLIPALNRLLRADASVPRILRYTETFSADPDWQLIAALVVFGVIASGSAAFRYAGDRLLLNLRADLELTLRTRLSRSILKMSWPAFLRLRVGDLNKGLVMEGFQINLGCHAFLSSIISCLIAGVFVVFSFFVSVPLTLFTLLFGAFGALFYYWMSHKSDKHGVRLSALQGSIGAKVNELFNNLKFFHGSGRTDAARRETERLFRDYHGHYVTTHKYGIVMRLFLELTAVLFVLAFLFSNYFLFQQSAAAMLVFLSLFYRLAPRLLAVHESFFSARSYASYWISWNDRLRLADSSPADAGGSRTPRYHREMRLHDVDFAFAPEAPAVLSGIELSIKQGESLAIVGPSGSGKTTLLDLLLGLLTPTRGVITLDGVPLNEVDIRAWRSRLGLVTQEAPIFYGSVLENIIWDENPDREKAVHASELAHARDFIEQLPDGFDTIIGEKGASLSGGQRQRLAIARALYRNPLMLILDEATSALDGESEAHVQRALEGLKGRLAILVVSHRLKSVEFTDRIIVLESGRIVEEGSPFKLLQTPGSRFRRMAELQGLAAFVGTAALPAAEFDGM